MKAALSAIILLFVLILSSQSPVSALTHAWSRQYGGTGTQHIAAVTTDLTGNVYAAGHFYNATDFGGGIRTSTGGSDIVLVKRGVRDDGSAVGSGVYFARMTTAGRTTGCKLVLLK